MSLSKLKILLVSLCAIGVVLLLVANTRTRFTSSAQAAIADDYIGDETCAVCHEAQAKAFAETKHSKLPQLASWKGKAKGCESCHGPGKEHSENEGDIKKIISFKNKTSKAISETCLACHAGKESHNNFRRGEHWRNDVGCTECHSTHNTHNQPNKVDPASATPTKAEAVTFPAVPTRDKPGFSTNAQLRASEPQLCMNCHTETKSQFSKPFHHKVLEGAMKCGDCHNAHGGFEAKQTNLAVGLDAACIKCHANKQGPFVYEHGPLKIEGCTACHSPHGSSNPKMLRRTTVRQLCLECHTGITEEIAPQAPSLHNQAQVRYQQCTVCHSSIHGSNSSRFYFR